MALVFKNSVDITTSPSITSIGCVSTDGGNNYSLEVTVKNNHDSTATLYLSTFSDFGVSESQASVSSGASHIFT
jgi:hypothetical protein